jgi:hypothetical protein
MSHILNIRKPSAREALAPFAAAAVLALAQLGLTAADIGARPGYAASPATALVQHNAAAAAVRLPPATNYDGPASCGQPGFLTGDTVGDGNPLAIYRSLCPTRP